jgi:hypothetical protein
VQPGADADLVLLGADPSTADARTLRSMPVSATVVGGWVTHGDSPRTDPAVRTLAGGIGERHR